MVLICLIAIIGCKNESKSTEKKISLEKNEPIRLLKGQFVYYEGAAVLQTSTDIYGVYVTDKMLELNEQAEAYKKQPTDMVLVEVKGIITNKKDDKILWENKLEIVEILNVSQHKPEENNVVKLGIE